MKKDSQDLEKKLYDQEVAELDASLLDRLESAAEGTLTELTEEEVRFEAKLRAIQPKGLGRGLLHVLEAKVEAIPAPTQVHVLPFPGPEGKNNGRELREQSTPRFIPNWATAAAAVALLGVLSAWWIDPMAGNNAALTGNPSPTRTTSPEPATPSTSPAEFSRAVANTQDQGIIWGENNEPHRVIKVTYTDRVSMKRDDGSTYEVEKPSVEYYLVPAESQ